MPQSTEQPVTATETSETSKLIGILLDRRYRMVKVLAKGGFGHTYLAEDTRRPHHPLCVVKQLKPANQDPNLQEMALKMFQREAEILERMGVHPQIPQLLAYFEEEGEFYIVQQYIDGQPLTKELGSRQKWSENRVRSFLTEMLPILSFIHGEGVIHRDVKPSNILRQKSDGKLFLIDFGAIKQLQSPSATQAVLTSATISIGTPGYMAIEQCMGKPRPGSDIFGLGATAIQGLTGIHPSKLKEDVEGELVWQAFTENLSLEFCQFLEKMVRSHFKERFKDGAEALQALSLLPYAPVNVDAKVGAPPHTPHVDVTLVDPTVLNYAASGSADSPVDTAPQGNTILARSVASSVGRSSHEAPTELTADLAALPRALANGEQSDQPNHLRNTHQPTIAIESKPRPRYWRSIIWLALPLAAVVGWQAYQRQVIYHTESGVIGELSTLKAIADYDKCLAVSHEFQTELKDTFTRLRQDCQQKKDQQTIQQAQSLLTQNKYTEAIALAQTIDSPASRQIIEQSATKIAQQIDSSIRSKGNLDRILSLNKGLPKNYSKYAELQTRVSKYQTTWNQEKNTVSRIKASDRATRWQEVADLSRSLSIPHWQRQVQAERARANRELTPRFVPPAPAEPVFAPDYSPRDIPRDIPRDTGTPAPRLPSPPARGGSLPSLDAAD